MEESGDMDVDDDLDGSDETGNHIILIMPFGGHVFELNGYSTTCLLDLGVVEYDWTDIAQQRLEWWSEAARETRVHNDIHAIVFDE